MLSTKNKTAMFRYKKLIKRLINRLPNFWVQKKLTKSFQYFSELIRWPTAEHLWKVNLVNQKIHIMKFIATLAENRRRSFKT